jgi:serine/threonine protein phosphatase PrpC
MEITSMQSSILETSLGKGQDFVAQGKKTNGDLWYLVMDGHGKNMVIDALRKLNYMNIMENDNPARIINDYVDQMGDTFNSGATLSLSIISPTEIKCYWKGDSTIKIWRDNEEIFVSENHNMHNATEAARMESQSIPTQDSWAPTVLSDTTLTMAKSIYYIFNTILMDNGTHAHDMLNMTNSLGHNGKTGNSISEACIKLSAGAKYEMVMATDGLWDMVHADDKIYTFNDASDLTNFAKHRWKQQWRYVFNGHPDQITRIPQGDDIGIAIWKGIIKE